MFDIYFHRLHFCRKEIHFFSLCFSLFNIRKKTLVSGSLLYMSSLDDPIDDRGNCKFYTMFLISFMYHVEFCILETSWCCKHAIRGILLLTFLRLHSNEFPCLSVYPKFLHRLYTLLPVNRARMALFTETVLAFYCINQNLQFGSTDDASV